MTMYLRLLTYVHFCCVTASCVCVQVQDLNLDLEAQRGRVADLEKKQRKFDQTLTEERTKTEMISEERDAAQREAREYATKTMALTQELEALEDKLLEAERAKKSLMAELSDQLDSKDDTGMPLKAMTPLFFIVPSCYDYQRGLS